eukprot:9060113-Alexandrium_andersonii.AAC.1
MPQASEPPPSAATGGQPPQASCLPPHRGGSKCESRCRRRTPRPGPASTRHSARGPGAAACRGAG